MSCRSLAASLLPYAGALLLLLQSLKHIELDKEMQAKQTPYDFYLTPTLLQIQKEHSEREKLGATRLRERSIP